jgi:hypothetical protein
MCRVRSSLSGYKLRQTLPQRYISHFVRNIATSSHTDAQSDPAAVDHPFLARWHLPETIMDWLASFAIVEQDVEHRIVRMRCAGVISMMEGRRVWEWSMCVVSLMTARGWVFAGCLELSARECKCETCFGARQVLHGVKRCKTLSMLCLCFASACGR